LAQPLLRKAVESRGGPENVTEEEAVTIIHDCMRVLYYRDARSLNKVRILLLLLLLLLTDINIIF
jgi:20S proteasome subunit beta 7